MGGTSHYVVRKRDHPGSSHQEIRDEPDWGAGHNHRVGFKNRENRVPGYTEEARGRAKALHDREARGELINFRDIVTGQKDLHLIRPENRSVGWRFALDYTEDWIKYGQRWPANEEAARKKAEEGEKKEQKKSPENGVDAAEGEAAKNGDDGKRRQHGDLKMTEEEDLSLEERAMLRAIRAEKEDMSRVQCNPGTLSSPQKHNRTDISIDEADQFTPDNWFPRCPDLIRLTGKHPLNAEAPLTRLLDAGLVTPNELHYVRNHGAVPRLLWEFHTVDVDVGGGRPARSFGMDEIRGAFPSVNIPVFLACDGNRRKELNMLRKSKGFNWGAGAVGCAYWKGALLRDVLIAAGLAEDEVEGTGGAAATGGGGGGNKSAGRHKGTGRRWVNFEGADELAEGRYSTCIPLAYAMDASNDVLLAYAMNDLPLPPDHGYPVRVIIPGHVGGRCVKWLSRVWVSEAESDAYYHIWDNRVLPTSVTDMESPFAEALFRHPDTACYEQNLNSVTVRPAHGEELSLAEAARPGAQYRVEGFAYHGGGHAVQRVELSLDDGASWLYCVRRYPDMPVRHGKKFWTWCHWHVDVPTARLVAARSLTVRCFDVFKNTQPREPSWNIMGMMNNAWYVVRSEVGQGDEGARLLFRHPVEPGTGDGGWMRPSVANQVEAARRDAGAPQKQFTREEVEKHDSEDDCWIVVGGKVYDATSVMAWHPGGRAPIMAHAGRMHQETTDEFESVHDDFAYEKLKECLLGTITDKAANFISENAKLKAAEDAKAAQSSSSHAATLQKHRWVPARLVAREALSADTRAYTFRLPANRAVLGLATCQHVLLGFHMKDKMLVRSYTPTRPVLPAPEGVPAKLPRRNGRPEDGWEEKQEEEQGHRDGTGTFQLVVKTYFPNDRQPGGAMSNILDCLPLGEEVEIRGPTGEIEYLGAGRFRVDGAERTFRRVSLVVGGSGVTPAYALMARVVLDPAEAGDGPEMRVVDANKSEDDILLRAEMAELRDKAAGKLDVTHVLSHPPEDGWEGETGHVNADMLRKHLFPPGEESAVFVCGPPTMMQKAVMPALRDWGYKEDEDLFGF